MTTGSRLAELINETAERGGQADHPGVRDRPRRGAALLDQAARGREADPGAAGVRRQPDGGRSARALHRAAERAGSGDAAGASATKWRRTARPRTSRADGAARRRGRNARSAPSAPSGSARSRPPQESKELTASKMPAIVISASGMATGGRVLHHLKAALPDRAEHACCLPASRRKARADAGSSTARRRVKIHGQMIPVHARIAHHRFDVGARGLEGDPALAARLQGAAEAAPSSCTASRPRWRRCRS